MNSCSNTRVKRHAASVVLFVWLFALASGIANACLLEAHAIHRHGIAVTHAAEAPEAPGVSAGHAGSDADHAAGSHPSKAPCLKVCDDGAQSLVKQGAGLDVSQPGLAPAFMNSWTGPTASGALAPGWVRDFVPPIPRVPIRVQFSRLAL